MATESATSRYESTEQTTNANRVCRLLLDPCTDQLRDVLRMEVPPHEFTTVIQKKKDKLLNLTQKQRDLILPKSGSYVGHYDDFDISLLYTLLRNICNIPPHKNGWGKDPDVTDHCLSANIERIRIARNNCVHSSKSSLSNSEFNDIWSTIRNAVVSVDSFLSHSSQHHYVKEVDFLLYTSMDPVQDQHYRDELVKQHAEDQETRVSLDNLRRK